MPQVASFGTCYRFDRCWSIEVRQAWICFSMCAVRTRSYFGKVYRKGGAPILSIHRTQPATMTPREGYDKGVRLVSVHCIISKFTFQLNAAKNTHYTKNASNKRSKLNFAQKNQWAHMSIFHTPPLSGYWERVQRLICQKYYNELKRESRFTLVLNAAKNMHYMNKSSK